MFAVLNRRRSQFSPFSIAAVVMRQPLRVTLG
jgi:hypothetical protein